MRIKSHSIKLLRRQCMAVCKVKDYTVGPADTFFFDTCVWICIFAPIAGSKLYKQKAYSSLLADIRSCGAFIWINSQVVAEYVNASLRIEFDQWKKRKALYQADFKHDYRTTAEYLSALHEIKNQMHDILSLSQRHPDDFHSMNVDDLIDEMGQTMDYGDVIMVSYCQENCVTLVTDDRDIVNSKLGINVITA